MKKHFTKWIGVLIFLLGLSSCSANVPADFKMIVDVRKAESAAESPTEHIYLELNHFGRSSYIIYETDGAIAYDSQGMISISHGQIIEGGSFKVTSRDLENIWQQIEDSQYFDLTDDYRMSIGGAYAFLSVTANSQTHTIDNIGMFLPEIQAIIQVISNAFPEEFRIEYSHEDFWPLE